MPIDLYEVFCLFKSYAKQLPKQTRRDAKVSFANWMGWKRDDRTTQYIRPTTWWTMPQKDIERAKLLGGPNGYTLFRLWVIQRLEDESI